MATKPTTFPKVLDYEMLISMPSAHKSEVRRQPINGQKFSTAGQEIQTVINRSANSFVIPDTLCLSFEVTCAYPNGTADASGVSHLIGNAAKFFKTFVSIANINGQYIDRIEQYGDLYCMLLNTQISPQDKETMWHLGYKEKYGYSNFGTSFEKGEAATMTQTFVVPVMSALTNGTKLIPAFLTDINLNFTLDSVANIFRQIAGGVLPESFEISKVNLCYELVTLEEAVFRSLMGSFPNQMTLKTSSFIYASSNLPADSTGNVDLVYPHSVQSATEFIYYCSHENMLDRNLGGCSPNAKEWSLLINNTNYPIQNVKSDRLSESFSQIKKSWASLMSTSHPSCLTRASFGKSANAGQPSAEYTAFEQTLTSSENLKLSQVSNMNYNILDLQRINNVSDVMLSGISTKNSVNSLRINISAGLAYALKVNMWTHYDMLITFDYTNSNVEIAQ
jgi:hypothetical protein